MCSGSFFILLWLAALRLVPSVLGGAGMLSCSGHLSAIGALLREDLVLGVMLGDVEEMAQKQMGPV